MMSLRNYENARNHWQHWASKLPDDEKKSYTLFEPKHSTFLKKQCALLGDSLHGLMVQQEAAKQYRRDVTQAQQRDIINAEKGYYRWQDKHVESMGDKHFQEKSSIQRVTGSYVFESYRLLKDEKINEEIQRLEAEQKKEERNKTANHDAVIAAIKKEIEELKSFLAQLPKMREAIEEFAEQQIQDELSAQSIARAQREHRTLGSATGEPGAVNDGYALTKAERDRKLSQIVEIPIRWGRGTSNVPLTVKESYDAAGNPEIEFEIAAKYIKKHRWGFRGIDQLNGAGRRALLAEMHDRMSKKNILAFGLNFEKIDSDDYEWYVKFLTTSLMLSNEHAKKQLVLSPDSSATPFSSDIITHDATIASMMKLMEKERSINRSLNGLFGGEALAVKRLNHDNCKFKTQLIERETNYVRDGVEKRGPNTALMAATNAAVASERLARAARNHIALALDKIKLGGGGVAKAAEALGLLNIAEKSAEAAYKNARTLASQARVELERQLAESRGTRKPTELRELEVLVAKADDRVRELAAAVAKIKSVRNSFHDAFDASRFSDDEKAALPRARGDKNAAFRALAPVIAADTASLAEIAKILYAACQAGINFGNPPFNPALAAWGTVVDAVNFFRDATPANKLAMLERAFSFNAAGTMAVLRTAHAKVAGHAPDPGLMRAILNGLEAQLQAEARRIVDARPGDFAEIARQNEAQRRAIVEASPASFADIARANDAQRRAIVEASPASFADIARANNDQRLAIVTASPESFAAIARQNDAQRRAIVEASPDSFAAIARANAGVLRTIVETSTESFLDIALNDPATLQAIIAASPEIVRDNPEALRAIIAASPESFAEIVVATPDAINMMASIIFNYNSVDSLEQVTAVVNSDPVQAITLVNNILNTNVPELVLENQRVIPPLPVLQELNRSGLAFNKVRDNGNCFYYAIASSLVENGVALDQAAQDAANIEFRRYVAQILLENRAQYQPLFEAMVAQATEEGRQDYDGLSFDQYVDGVRSGQGPWTSAWADNLTIGALAQHLGRPIHIIGPDGDSIASATEDHTGEPLFVFYNGTNHYDALVSRPGMARSQILSHLKFSQAIRNAVSTATPDQINAGIARAAGTGVLNAEVAKATISHAVETQGAAFDILFDKVQQLAQAGNDADAAIVAAAGGAHGDAVKDAMSAALGAADADVANAAIVAAAAGEDGVAVIDAMSVALGAADAGAANAAIVTAVNVADNAKNAMSAALGDPNLDAAVANAAIVTAATVAGPTGNAVKNAMSAALGAADAGVARNAIVTAATVAGPTGNAVKNAMSVALRERAIAHPDDPAVQAVIKRVLAIANPDAVAANSAIDALASVVREDAVIISLLAEILVDAQNLPVDAANRANVIHTQQQHIQENLDNAKADIRTALSHNPAAAIMVLNTAYAKLAGPEIDPEALAVFVNTFPASAAAIVALLPERNPARAANALVTADDIRIAQTQKVAFQAAIKNALAIANPASIAKALNSDPIAKEILNQGAAQCRKAVRDARKDVTVDDSAMSLSAASKDIASVQVNYAAAIAARRVAIGALTRVVTGGGDAAALAVIENVDSDVWASLVVAGFSDASKTAIAATIPVAANPGAVALDAAAARLMLNNPESAKIALKAALNNPPRTAEEIADARQAIRAGIQALGPVRGQQLVRVALEAEPRVTTILVAVIPADLEALTEQDVREIAKVDLAACALILNDALAAPAPAVRAVSDELIRAIAKWVPSPPAGDVGQTRAQQLGAAVTMLRGAAATDALRAALSANPVEAQAAINAAIDGVGSGVLAGDLLRNVKAVIAQNPLAAIDAHPEVRAARDRFVAIDPRIMAAQHALEVARRQAREGVPAGAKPRSEAGDAALKAALVRIVTLSTKASANLKIGSYDPVAFGDLHLVVQAILNGSPALPAALGKHLPTLLLATDESKIAIALTSADPEVLVAAFTDPTVVKLLTVTTQPLPADFRDAIHNYVAKSDAAIEEAVERDRGVIAARNALEEASVAASTHAGFAAFIAEARGKVAEGAKQHIVQGKLRQQLAEGKLLTGDSISGAIRTVEFTPEGAQTPIIVSADEARETAIQVLQDFERDLTTIAAAFDKQLKDAEACKAGTEKSEMGEKAIGRLEVALAALKRIELRDSEKAMVKQAHEFLDQLKDPESLLGRLFDDSLVEQAQKEVKKATDDVTKLETELTAYRERTPARVRDAQLSGAVLATKNSKIPDELISADVINGVTAMPEGSSEIVRARAKEYIAQLKNDRNITRIYDKNNQPTDEDINASKRRVFQSDPTMRAARASAIHHSDNRDIRQFMIAAGNDSAKVLKTLEEIAVKSDNSVVINGNNFNGVEARALLDIINAQPVVYQALNETLDKQPSVKAVWSKAIENDPEVKNRVTGLAIAKEKVTTATANVAKIEDQVASVKQGVVALSKVLDEVETTQPERAEEVKEVLQATKVRLDASAKAAEQFSLNYSLPSNRT